MFYFLQPTSSVVSEELAGSAHLAFSMLRIFPVAANQESGVLPYSHLFIIVIYQSCQLISAPTFHCHHFYAQGSG